MSTLRMAVSGEKQNSCGNLKISPGIGRIKFNEVTILGSLRFFGNASQKSGDDFQIFGMTFSTHGSAQTAYVRAVTPPS